LKCAIKFFIDHCASFKGGSFVLSSNTFCPCFLCPSRSTFFVFIFVFLCVCVFRAGFRAKHGLPLSAAASAERGVSIGERRRKITPGRGCCEFCFEVGKIYFEDCSCTALPWFQPCGLWMDFGAIFRGLGKSGPIIDGQPNPQQRFPPCETIV
jgi:hypothetical protein